MILHFLDWAYSKGFRFQNQLFYLSPTLVFYCLAERPETSGEASMRSSSSLRVTNKLTIDNLKLENQQKNHHFNVHLHKI